MVNQSIFSDPTKKIAVEVEKTDAAGVSEKTTVEMSVCEALFLYAAWACKADVGCVCQPEDPKVEDIQIPISIDETVVPYAEVRKWIRGFTSHNLIFADFFREEGAFVTDDSAEWIVGFSHAHTDRLATMTYLPHIESLQLTELGLQVMNELIPAMYQELHAVEAMICMIIRERYCHEGMGITNAFRHIPTIAFDDMNRDFHIVERADQGVVFAMPDGHLFVTVLGVGTFLLEVQRPINLPFMVRTNASIPVDFTSPESVEQGLYAYTARVKMENEKMREEWYAAHPEAPRPAEDNNIAQTIGELVSKMTGSGCKVAAITPNGVDSVAEVEPEETNSNKKPVS